MNEMGLTLTVSQAGDYYAVAANGECATTSQTVQVNVTPLPNIELSVGSMNQICEGDQLTIENMGNADGYQWFQDGELLPISGNALTVSESGNYQLIVTNGECAVNSEIINVAVVNAPDSGLNVGTNNEICEGETLLLEVTAGASNYQWFLNGEMTANNEPTLSATTAGEYFVMIGSGDCSSVSSTINLEIIPLPNPQLSAAGEQSICQGETFNVSVPNNADNYQWYFNDAPIGNNTFQFSTMEAGEYYVISENAGCSVTSELIFLTVNPFPNADVQTTAVQLCPGETAVLSTPSQGQSYQWFLNGSSITSANNTSLTISDGGTYSLSVTQAGCTAVSVNLFIEIFTPIVPEITFDSEILTSTPAGSYQWLLNGDPIAGAIDQTFVPTENGDYAVQIIDNNGCEATSEPLNVLINAVQDIALANEFLLFPNPAKNELFLENQSEDLLNGQLVIFNNLGIELFEINMDFANHFTQKIDIKHWSAGVYYLKITATDGRFFVKRFVKE